MVTKNFLKTGSLRRSYWYKNALLSFPLRLFKSSRNKKLWIFGSWAGAKYDDSCRYLYEYVLVNRKDIEAFWITRNVDLFDQLSSEGKPVLLSETNEAKNKLLNAGVVFYSNGLDDISYPFYFSGALIIDLNHAPLPIKSLNYFNFQHKYFFVNLLKKIKRALLK